MKNIYKKIILLIILLFSSFSFFSTTTYWWVFDWASSEIPYCKWNDCGLEKWVDDVKHWIKDMKTDGNAKDTVQDLVKYILSWVSLIAFIYVVYAWFRILTSSGEDETIKKSKKIIIYVIIWILVIWFAWAIAHFAIEIWRSAN